MPINQAVFTFNDDLEKRIKNLCYDPLPKDSIRRIQCEANQGIGMIHPGARFNGFQSSNTTGIENEGRYDVSIEFQNVDMINSMLSGYLTIKNLTTVSQIKKKKGKVMFMLIFLIGISGINHFL